MTGLQIVIAIVVLFVVMIISNNIGYNHGYHDGKKDHLDLMFEKDENIKELCLKIGELQNKILEIRNKSHK